MKWDEVIGQQAVKQRLMQMESEGRLPHAIMLCGPAGSGKMALALAFASYLLCSNHKGNSEACGTCNSCAMLRKWQHPDLHFTYPTIKRASMGADHKPVSDDFAAEWNRLLAKGPYFSMDSWLNEIEAENQQAIITAGESDNLSHKLSMKSSQGGYKVSLIWMPERMNGECANKLLKLIEEPPTHTLFIMVCEEPDKLLETIRSRVQRIDVRKIDTADMEQALVTRRGIDGDTAHRLARIANGNWLKAVEQLDADNENEMFLDLFQSLMRLAYQRKIKDLKRWSETMAAFGREKQKRFLSYLLRLIRENFMYNFAQPQLTYMTEREEQFAKNFARFINEDNILQIYDLTNKAIRDIGQNANGKIVFFDLALQMIVLLIPPKK
ncbi:MAG: DNA polymerase III subunit delta [Prevotella sp.]|nr:DNA polymerase III subunit delta [Prevotella sp.]